MKGKIEMAKTLALHRIGFQQVRQDARMRKLVLPTALFLAFLFGMALIQFSTPDMPDNDGFYHIKLAWLMRTEGLKPAFPFLPLSILNANAFYDHHFLFHVALIPFTFGDLRMGAKWAAVVFAGLAFLAVWYLLYRQRVPYAWLWALGLLGISDAFLFRMSITARPVAIPGDACPWDSMAFGRQTQAPGRPGFYLCLAVRRLSPFTCAGRPALFGGGADRTSFGVPSLALHIGWDPAGNGDQSLLSG